MSTESVWQTYGLATSFPSLSKDVEVDVAIIGGGITGITTAQLLKESGLRVAVIESLKVGVSNTGHSTGNLYEVMGSELLEIRKKYPAAVVEKLIRSRREAVDFIEANIKRFQIDCDFRRTPWYFYSAVEKDRDVIERHLEICQEIGVAAVRSEIQHPSLKSLSAICIENQAQFNPLRYTQALAKAIHDEQCLIFENSSVLDVDEKNGKLFLKTEDAVVTAAHVIHATHTPKGVMAYHTLMEPYREYGIAAKVKDPQHPPGVHFGLYGVEHFSTRLYERDGQHYLIVVGSPHKVGHSDTNHEMRKLEAFATKHFSVIELTHRWGGQHYRPADEIPYIGKKGTSARTYVATGFSTHGLVYGTVAAAIITDQILGKANQYEEIYSAARFTPMKSAKKFMQESKTTFTALVSDYLHRDRSPLASVAPGEGKILDHEGHKLAVFRNEENELKVCSAVCTHIGCIVRWNNDEKSWDCPCHGSRFDTDGEVLEGPALHALAKADLVHDEKPLRNPVNTIRDNLGTGLST